VSSGLT